MLKLQAAVRYELDEVPTSRSFVEQCLPDDPDVVVANGCLLFKEGKYEEARAKFVEGINLLGYQPQLAYNIALCYYKTKQYAAALKEIAQIIERGIREHPGMLFSSVVVLVYSFCVCVCFVAVSSAF